MTFECEFFSLTEAEVARYRVAYPLIDVMKQFRQMDAWLFSNPNKRYKNYKRFINNWLKSEKPDNFKKAETRIKKEKEEYRKKYQTVPEGGYAKPSDIAKILNPLKEKMRMKNG